MELGERISSCGLNDMDQHGSLNIPAAEERHASVAAIFSSMLFLQTEMVRAGLVDAARLSGAVLTALQPYLEAYQLQTKPLSIHLQGTKMKTLQMLTGKDDIRSLMLEKEVILALEDIARRENLSLGEITQVIFEAMPQSASAERAIGVFIAAYYRSAA
jgi:predicted DNA-binding ribbon-helix-helix protein